MFDSSLTHLDSNAIAMLHAANEMDSTVLITGSTGTGKSHLAYAIHRASEKRRAGKWFKINLATLSENLIESELFGHEKGSFTGADSRRVGKLESCNGGTIFLDEIGELPLRLQAKLLDFIQYKKIFPVGSNKEIELNVRIIAATNKNLETAVKEREFRSDLYHRLNVFHLRLRDLNESPYLTSLLARDFLQKKSEAAGKRIKSLSRAAEQILRAHSWPGNIRELENAIEYGVAMEKTASLQTSSLPLYLQEIRIDVVEPFEPKAELYPPHLKVGNVDLPFTVNFHESKEAFEKAYLEQVLKLFSGQINLTSRRIGLNKVSLSEKIKKYAIDWRQMRYDTFAASLETAASTSSGEIDFIQC